MKINPMFLKRKILESLCIVHVFIILIFYNPSKLSGVDHDLNILTKISYFHLKTFVLSLVTIKPSAKKAAPSLFLLFRYTLYVIKWTFWREQNRVILTHNI